VKKKSEKPLTQKVIDRTPSPNYRKKPWYWILLVSVIVVTIGIIVLSAWALSECSPSSGQDVKDLARYIAWH